VGDCVNYTEEDETEGVQAKHGTYHQKDACFRYLFNVMLNLQAGQPDLGAEDLR